MKNVKMIWIDISPKKKIREPMHESMLSIINQEKAIKPKMI